MTKLTPAELHRRQREDNDAQERRKRVWQEEQAELVRRGLADPLDDFTQMRRTLAYVALFEQMVARAEQAEASA